MGIMARRRQNQIIKQKEERIAREEAAKAEAKSPKKKVAKKKSAIKVVPKGEAVDLRQENLQDIIEEDNGSDGQAKASDPI